MTEKFKKMLVLENDKKKTAKTYKKKIAKWQIIFLRKEWKNQKIAGNSFIKRHISRKN